MTKTQQGYRLRGYISDATVDLDMVNIKDPSVRKTTTVAVSKVAKRFLRHICPALPYGVQIKEEGLHAWMPDLSTTSELGRFLSYCGIPMPKSALNRIDLDAFIADPAAVLDPATLTPDTVERLARSLPPGFVALSRHLVKLDASARDIHQIHAALVAKSVSPEQYLPWLKTHAFDLLETEGFDAGFPLLNRLATGCSDTARIAGAVMAVIVGNEKKRGHTVTSWGDVTWQASWLLGHGKNTDAVYKYLCDQSSKEPQSTKQFYFIKGPSSSAKGSSTFVAREPTSLCERNTAWGTVDQQARRLTKRLQVSLPGPLAADQEAVLDAIRKHRFVVVAGAAGTGKTHLVRDIGDAMAAAGNEVAWTATTGRAARVLHEGGTTLHAFLGIRPGSPKHRNEQRVDLLVVDETSMLDTWLAGPLGSYMTDGLAERVVLIGDPYQLPPVGAGKVLSELRDLAGGCLSSSQVVELTTMRRTDATGILAVAKAIRARQPLPDFNDTPGVSVYPANKLALSKVVDLAGGHPDDALVIAPRKDGPLGVRSLNAALRDAHLGLSDEMWIEGMRVVQNKTKKIEERDNLIVPNGTFGVITRITTEAITVTYEDGVEVDWQHKQCAYDDGMIAPAYALTIHKAQGSQASHVVVVADPGIPEAWKDPAMGYTAVTRAIHDLVVIGDPEVLRGNPDTGVEERLTMLVPRMLHRLAKPQQAKGS